MAKSPGGFDPNLIEANEARTSIGWFNAWEGAEQSGCQTDL